MCLRYCPHMIGAYSKNGASRPGDPNFSASAFFSAKQEAAAVVESGLLIIADDLTGAADTGVQFLGLGPVRLAGLNQPVELLDGASLTLNTATRNLDRERVPHIMNQAARLARRLQPRLIYKKIDSCVRGHVGLEISLLLARLNYRLALVAPAYPAFGRVTIDDLHYVGGRLVSETETARDPFRPVTEAHLSAILGQGHDFPVRPLTLNVIRAGADQVVLFLTELLKTERPCFVAADAETEEDLSILAQAGLTLSGQLIMSGSAGLAGALADLLPGPTASPAKPPSGPAKPILYLGGSASETLAKQFEYLTVEEGVPLATLEVAGLFGGKTEKIELPPQGALAVKLPPPDERSEVSSEALIRRFGLYAARLIERIRPRTIFLSGGDTAQAVFEALDLSEIWLRAELEPGVVWLESGPWALVTKSGGFGTPDLLGRLHRALGS